jgi:hypothetical protein
LLSSTLPRRDDLDLVAIRYRHRTALAGWHEGAIEGRRDPRLAMAKLDDKTAQRHCFRGAPFAVDDDLTQMGLWDNVCHTALAGHGALGVRPNAIALIRVRISNCNRSIISHVL